MPEGELRRALGRLVAVFGLLHLLPSAFVWLSSHGPSPVLVTGRAWSVFFYSHFIALCVCGFGLQGWSAAKSRLFHGGPMIDFLLGVAGFMLLETAVAFGLRGGEGSSLPALLPGSALVVFGLRLSSGAPLLGD